MSSRSSRQPENLRNETSWSTRSAEASSRLISELTVWSRGPLMRRCRALASDQFPAAADDARHPAVPARLGVLLPTLAPSGPPAFGGSALSGGARGPYVL